MRKHIEWLQNDVYPRKKELKRLTLTIRYYLGKRHSLAIQDGLLVDKTTDVKRAIIPHKLQSDVIASFHHDDFAGIDHTYKIRSVHYLWHHMQTQEIIYNYVRAAS